MPLTEAQRAFLRDNAFSAVVTTLRADGSPHSTVVWVDEEDGDLVFNTAEGRAKAASSGRRLRACRSSSPPIPPTSTSGWP